MLNVDLFGWEMPRRKISSNSRGIAKSDSWFLIFADHNTPEPRKFLIMETDPEELVGIPIPTPKSFPAEGIAAFAAAVLIG